MEVAPLFNKLGRKLISIIILIILSFPATTYAVSQRGRLNALQQKINSKKAKLNQNNKTKSDLDQDIKQADKELRDIQIKLDKLTVELNSVRERMNRTQAQLDNLRNELSRKEQELEKARRELNRLTGLLNHRAQDFYKGSDVSYLEVLLSSKNFADLIHRAEFLSRIVNKDAELLHKIKDTKAAIEAAKSVIEANKRDIEKKNNALAAQEDNLAALTAKEQAQKNNLAAQLSEKKNLLSNINSQQDQLAAEIAAEERDAAALERLLNNPSGNGGVITVGAPSSSGFVWPVHGPITGSFGERRPGHMHAGIDISVGWGTPVLAAKAGVVSYAGWMSGYGYIVVINHGGGLSTRYAHNSRLLVSVGQAVAQGQKIADSGSTGHSTGPHVHFEVRVNGAAVNPLNYLP